MKLLHKFVKNIPEEIEENTLYISIDYRCAIHKCCCGCGKKVVTPFSPTDWKLIFDGETVSISPSIGNWSFPCRSHYLIQKNAVIFVSKWSDRRINLNRKKDLANKKRYAKKKRVV